MIDLQQQIASKVEASRNDIITFIQKLIKSPSLANDEGPVQTIIQDKLSSLGSVSYTHLTLPTKRIV